MGTEKVLVDDAALKAISDAIRSKSATTTTYKPREMASAIMDIPSAIDNDSLLTNVLYEFISKTGLTKNVLDTDPRIKFTGNNNHELTAYALVSLTGTSLSGSDHAVLLNSVLNWSSRQAPAFYVRGGNTRQIMCNAYNDDAYVGDYIDGQKFAMAYSINSSGLSRWFSSIPSIRRVYDSAIPLTGWISGASPMYSKRINGTYTLYYIGVAPEAQSDDDILSNMETLLAYFNQA